MHHHKSIAISLIVLSAINLISCSTMPNTQASQATTAAQTNTLATLDPSALVEPIPRQEKASKTGNPKTYKVHGKYYQILASSEDFSERGLASWYGPKFHGRRTSSGERYDMYAITAAHKTLPIPTYVRVTRLDNGKNIVVRINDRGPFINGRIIDLSYAAASKIGMLKQGTVPVEIVALSPYQQHPQAHAIQKQKQKQIQPQQHPSSTPDVALLSAVKTLPTTPSIPVHPADLKRYYLQVGAFNQRQSAEQLQRQVSASLGQATIVSYLDGLHKVRIGPFDNHTQIEHLNQRLAIMGLEQTQVIYE